MSNDVDNTLEFQCPKCARKLKAKAKAAGKRFDCPKCGASVKVPGQAPAPQNDDDWLKLDGEPEVASAPAPENVAAKTKDQPTKSQSSPVSAPPQARVASIFDDDLPELAELEPPRPRTNVANILGLDDIEELVPVTAKAKANAGSSKSSSEKPDGKQEKTKRTAALDPANAQYRCACPACGTPQYVTLARQGKMVRCPDCFLDFKIPPPPPGWSPTQAATVNWSNDVMQLTPAEAQRDAQHRSQQADDILKKAERELDENDLEDLYDGADFDTDSFVIRTFGFLRDPAALFQVLTYCVLFAIFFGLLQYSLNLSKEHRGFLLFAALGVPALMIITSFPMFGAAISILEAVANGLPRVRDWHGFNFFDQMGELMMFAVASAASAAPGFLIGSLIAQSPENSIIVVLASMVSSYLTFPIILLSMMDNESMINPFSPDVLKSLKVGFEAWGTYYFKTLAANIFVFIVWTILHRDEPVLAGIGGLFFPLLFFFSIQQLGVLAHDISEHLSIIVPPPSKDEEDAVEENRELA